MVFNNRLIVNHQAYLKEQILKGTIACLKRLSEMISRVTAEIMILMARLTNLNLKAGSEVPLPYVDVRDVRYYVVCLSFSQSKQPAANSRKNRERPKSIELPGVLEFGIARSTKVPGQRRLRSTIIIDRKGARYSTMRDARFAGLNFKHQFEKLEKDIKLGNKANNLTTIMSDKEFLISCY